MRPYTHILYIDKVVKIRRNVYKYVHHTHYTVYEHSVSTINRNAEKLDLVNVVNINAR